MLADLCGDGREAQISGRKVGSGTSSGGGTVAGEPRGCICRGGGCHCHISQGLRSVAPVSAVSYALLAQWALRVGVAACANGVCCCSDGRFEVVGRRLRSGSIYVAAAAGSAAWTPRGRLKGVWRSAAAPAGAAEFIEGGVCLLALYVERAQLHLFDGGYQAVSIRPC